MKKRKRKHDDSEDSRDNKLSGDKVPNKSKQDAKVQTISCSFRNITSHLDEKKKKQVLNIVEHLVATLSRLRNETSILANYLLLDQCEKGFNFDIHLGDAKRWQQFYRACMMKILKEKSGKIETSNHKKTAKQLHETKHLLDKKLVTKIVIQDEIQLKQDIQTKHKREKKLALLEKRYYDENLRAKSTAYINNFQWESSSFNYKKALEGYRGVLDVLAREMCTNALNSLTLTFENRQRKTIMLDYPKFAAEKICTLINCPLTEIPNYIQQWQNEATESKEDTLKSQQAKSKRRLTLEQVRSEETSNYIKLHRKQIRGDVEELEEKWIDEKYIEKHSVFVLCYFHFFLKHIERKREELMRDFKQKQKNEKEKPDAKLKKLSIKVFHLLPLSHYKRCFVDIQPRLFTIIAKKVFPEKDLNKKRNDWSQLFCFDKVRCNQDLVFEGNIKTDGVRACILFGDGKRKVGYQTRKTVNFQRRTRMEEAKKKKSNPVSWITLDSQTKGLYEDSHTRINLASFKKPCRVISVDPGRSDVVTVFDSQSNDCGQSRKNGQFRHMSKREYYHLRKTKVFAKRREFHWKKYLEKYPQIQLDKQCFATSSSKNFLIAWKERLSINNLIWKYYLQRMHSEWDFEMYKAKQRTQVIITKRIMGMTNKNIPTLVAYGSGAFPCAVLGHAATPLKDIPRNLSHHALVIMTNEDNTSKVCFNCKEKTLQQHTLASYKQTKEVRKLKRNVGKNLKVLTKPIQKIQLNESRKITRWRRKYEQTQKGACFKILACAQHCSKRWIYHRDYVACLNIAEKCLETCINGKPPNIFKKKSALVEGQGREKPISTTQ